MGLSITLRVTHDPHFIIRKTGSREVVCLAEGGTSPRGRSQVTKRVKFILKPPQNLFLYCRFADENTEVLRHVHHTDQNYSLRRLVLVRMVKGLKERGGVLDVLNG